MFKKTLSLIMAFLLIGSSAYAGAKNVVTIDSFSGLDRNPFVDRLKDGAHSKFDNMYVKNGNLEIVKGRDRLVTSALTNTTTNGFWYYEGSGGTKKILRLENTVFASYDTDGTNRTSLNTGLTNEPHDGVQIGDTFYFTSATDGLYKWTGSGAASAISGVSSPSGVSFSAASGTGGMTCGQDIKVVADISTDAACNTQCDGTTTNNTSCTFINDAGGDNVTSDTGTLETAATTTTYSYKVTSYSSTWGIESEPSSATTVTLTGDDHFSWSPADCHPCDFTDSDVTCDNNCCSAIQYVTSGKKNSTTGTLASSPSSPFDKYRIYRTVAGGSDYFLLGSGAGGATYTDGKPDTALGSPLDTTIDTTNPPAYRYIEEYKGSIFLANGTTIYFNRLPVGAISSADTYWLESDKLTTGAKKSITGLHKTSDSLEIFTSDRILELTGFGATSFRLKPIVEGIGSVSDETVETDSQGDIIFFAGTAGVYKLRTFSQLQDNLTGASVDTPRVRLVKISSPNLDEVFKGTDSQISLTVSDYTSAHAYYDSDDELYFLYVGNDCFVYDNVNSAWTHIPATKMTASVYRKSPSSAGQGMLMDSYGFMFNNWKGYENGIESGTVTGSATSSTSTTLTCSTCTFNTTGDGLKGLWVGVLNDTEGIQYRQISSNTGTALTVSSAWTTNPVTADVFYVAYIIPDVRTKAYSLGKPPKKTSIGEFWLTYRISTASQTIYVYTFQNSSELADSALSFATDTDTSAINSIKKFNMPLNTYWMQWGLRSYVYNTSNSINPPIDIISYSFKGEALEEL